MKRLSAVLLFIIFGAQAFSGGPSLESDGLSIGKVLVSANEIVMEVNGTIGVLTRKTPDEDMTHGNGKVVQLVVKDALLVIPKMRLQHPEGEVPPYKDWDRYKADMKKFEGTRVSAQMWYTELKLRDSMITEISSEICYFTPSSPR